MRKIAEQDLANIAGGYVCSLQERLNGTCPSCGGVNWENILNGSVLTDPMSAVTIQYVCYN